MDGYSVLWVKDGRTTDMKIYFKTNMMTEMTGGESVNAVKRQQLTFTSFEPLLECLPLWDKFKKKTFQ